MKIKTEEKIRKKLDEVTRKIAENMKKKLSPANDLILFGKGKALKWVLGELTDQEFK